MNGIEKQIIRHLATQLIADGHHISVDYDGGYCTEDEYKDLTDPEKVIEGCDAVDEVYLMLDATHEVDGESCAQFGWIYCIWGNGNDGKDCISNYSGADLDKYIDPIYKWLDTAEVVLEGNPYGN